MNAILASVVALFFLAMPLNENIPPFDQDLNEDVDIVENIETTNSEEANVTEDLQTTITEEQSAEVIDIIDNFQTPLASGCEYFLARGYIAYHKGIDIVPLNARDCKVIAAEAGEVTFAGWGDQGEGFMIEIKHADGYVTKYMHGNGDFYVTEGDMVTSGQPIMMIGCTGFCTGKHLHFSLLKNGIEIDPLRSPTGY